ncbi:hypothetical protein [Nocardia crassostreae]|uniref:hypothetical protein n=1 Tax=Nocardia crassostreae TaxID=53428 RepID=UPI0012F8533A|nr:hypothetical protein [Nocardia crassostreae]
MSVLGAFVLGATLATAPPVRADRMASGADLSVAQSLGERELTVIVRRAQPVPGPLRVEVVTHAGTAPGALTLTATPSDRTAETSSTRVELGHRPGPYPATLRVTHAGPWELAVSDGERTARIPFLVPAQVVTPWERAAYGGFCVAGALLLVALGSALLARRTWPTLAAAGAMIAALSVGVTGAVLSSSAPPPRAAGILLDPTSDTVDDPYPELDLPLTTKYSRPPVNMAVHADQPTGRPAELRLSLTDSATGRPVDDLLVSDDALLHLMVVGPSGRLWHRHPIRTAPGEYRVLLGGTESGEYALAAEIARRGGGLQFLRSSVSITGESAPGTPDPAPAGAELSIGDPVAGEPTTLTAKFGGPADLQPWLGMLGHLIAVGPLPAGIPAGTAAGTAPIWAHAHAMTPLPPAGGQAPDETVAAYGPNIPFTFTFPLPGRYLIWVQAERGYSVLTLPATVEVRAGAAR